jgi:hypothetical protein
VGDAQHGAGPLHDRILQRPQEVHIRIVGRLVQHQQVAILLQHLHQSAAKWLQRSVFSLCICHQRFDICQALTRYVR